MPLDPLRVKALFQSAHDLADPAARAAFLDRACAADQELRHRVDDLLRAVEGLDLRAGRPSTSGAAGADFTLGEAPAGGGAAEPTIGLSDFGATLDAAASVPAGPTIGVSAIGAGPGPGPAARPSPPPADAAIGSIVAGRYKVRQAIGEGGMGTVYLAEQVQPVRRQVALKLIRAGMDSRTVLARFESERQALAIIDHPHIARVLDAGTTETGHPYFVMELVRGVPLTDYCDAHRLGLPARLGLFRQICAAVQHAHQKGVIHRDLKPTNILVEDHDGTPVPKVIDFGLAKATSGLGFAEASVFTAFGTIAGTPLYMAPEQATFSALDVDTRADIYALGVILYELLTGSTPIRRESLQRAAFDEVLRVIREEEAQIPSHRISTSAALPSLAASRHVEPARLGRFVRGDLDWIVMKALAKERSRRYDSAIGLANDVERFLKDEPVTAGPPTARYRTAKFVRRHRRQVVAASLVALALVGGVVGTTLGLFEARKQRDLARAETAEKERARSAEADQRLKAETARQNEAQSRQVAERRSGQLGKVNDILSSIFRDLNLNQAEKEGKPVVAAIGERLDQASAALDGESIGDPLTVARLQMTLGQAQSSLGYYKKAIDLLERARATLVQHLGPDNATTLSCIALLAWFNVQDGHYERAIALLKPIVAVLKVKFGPEHPETLTTMYYLAEAYREAGQYDWAIPLHEQALAGRRIKLGSDHPDTLASMDLLALSYHYVGRFDLAVPMYEQVVEARKSKLGPDHPDTFMSMSDLANVYGEVGRFDRAVPLHEQVLAGRRARLGPGHPETLASMNNLAMAYRVADRLDRAIPLFEQAFEGMAAKIGPDHPETLIILSNLANAYVDVGRFYRAIPMQEQALAGRRATLGPDHQRTLRTMSNLANAYRDAGQLDRAIPLHEQALAAIKVRRGPEYYHTLTVMAELARDYDLTGRYDRAVPLFEQALAGRRAKLGLDHPDTLRSMEDLAGAYAEVGEREKAIALDREWLESCRRCYGPDSPMMARAQSSISSRLLRWEKWAEAEPMLRESLATREAKLPDDWRTFDTRSLLGGALLGLGKHDEARPLLVAGFEGMKQRLATIPAPDWVKPVAAADRLIRLAEATGKSDEAKAWREEKARIEAQLKPVLPAASKPAGATP